MLTPDMPVAEAGRQILAAELAIFLAHEEMVRATADPAAVYEMRKALRRTFTAVKLFRPFFIPGELDLYRRPLKKMMRRLAASRDTAVFLDKLRLYLAESAEADLGPLAVYWQARQTAIDADLRAYLSRPKCREFLAAYRTFTLTPAMGTPPAERLAPDKIAHLAPVLIYERLAAVRAYEDALADLSPARLHQLRIQSKELRYTLQFFVPLLGEASVALIETVKQMQDHLGDLNDAVVALRLLAETSQESEAMATAVAVYGRAKDAEIEALVAGFAPLWQAFDNVPWRQALAMAIADL